MNELLARLRAAVRRAEPVDRREEPVVDAGDLRIDLARRQVSRAGEEVRLSPTEWALLEVLVRNRGRLVDRKLLLHEVWGPAYSTETNYLRVYTAQLRRKLEKDPSHPAHPHPPGGGLPVRGVRRGAVETWGRRAARTPLAMTTTSAASWTSTTPASPSTPNRASGKRTTMTARDRPMFCGHDARGRGGRGPWLAAAGAGRAGERDVGGLDRGVGARARPWRCRRRRSPGRGRR